MDIDLKKESKEKFLKLNDYLIGRGREDLLLVGLSLLAGIIFDYLFYGSEIGLSYPIFVIVFISLFFCIYQKYLEPKFDLKLLLLIPIFFLSLTFFFFSNSFLSKINFLIIPVLIIAQTVLLTENNRSKWYKLKFINDIAY